MFPLVCLCMCARLSLVLFLVKRYIHSGWHLYVIIYKQILTLLQESWQKQVDLTELCR